MSAITSQSTFLTALRGACRNAVVSEIDSFLATKQALVRDLLPLASPADEKALTELTLRILLSEYTSNRDPQTVDVQLSNLIDLSIKLAEQVTYTPSLIVSHLSLVKDHVEPYFPFALIADALDTQTIFGCEKSFRLLESRTSVLTSPKLFTPVTGLHLLKLCNSLLRRLSKTNNTAFCGRILMLLAYLFPIDEKSGVNLGGKFNVANKTLIESDPSTATSNSTPSPSSSSDVAPMIVDDQHPVTPVQELDQMVDFRFYRTLWTLQNFFSNPTELGSKFAEFASTLATVLSAFEATKLHKSHSKEGLILSQVMGSAPQNSEETTNFFPKYLTSSRLLGLQLRDPVFRHYLLLQTKIIFNYLTDTQRPVLPASAKAGAKPAAEFKEPQPPQAKRSTGTSAAIRAAGAELSALYKNTVTLNARQKETLEQLRVRLDKLIATMPPDGVHLEQLIETILQRERNWLMWKNSNPACPTIRKAPLTSQQFAQTIDALFPTDESKDSKAKPGKKGGPLPSGKSVKDSSGRIMMGSVELNRLWSLCPEDGIKAFLSDSDRQFQPPLSDFLDELIANELDSSIEESEKLHNDHRFAWRTMRAACQSNVALVMNKCSVKDYIRDVMVSRKLVEPTKAKTGTATASGTAANPTDDKQDNDMAVEDKDMKDEVDILTTDDAEKSESPTPVSSPLPTSPFADIDGVDDDQTAQTASASASASASALTSSASQSSATSPIVVSVSLSSFNADANVATAVGGDKKRKRSDDSSPNDDMPVPDASKPRKSLADAPLLPSASPMDEDDETAT